MTRWTTAPDGRSERTATNSTACEGVPPTGGAAVPAREETRTTPAEWARTLAQGTVAGTLHLPRADAADGCGGTGGRAPRGRARTQSLPVTHLSDATGGLLLLVELGTPLHARLLELGAEAGEHGLPVVLDVLDVPPGQAALPRARLCVTGWALAVPPAEQRRVAQAAAAARPLGALLDVGSTRQLWRVDPGDVRVTTADGVHLVAEEALLTATPDPLYDDEDALVTHLEAHHSDELIGWVLRTLPLEQAREVREVSVVGADRYGLDVLCTVAGGTTLLRGAFDAPVRSDADLPAALCRLFGCPCARRGALAGAHR
ncbi:hypothetical protein GTR02_08905 [Kineococcus sp. R8]|uniref:DUF2470 domain-containing protein n=1 Tax=Kineococcus siccus TaxID=2696567 RepID=UPI001411EA9B|nr:DUF2470 domain-containing protein [Kineococcus siccus]NAZ81937.1 hypothetical protein [Kineococcus siccus]